MKKAIVLAVLIFLTLSLSSQENTTYYFSKIVSGNFDEVCASTKKALKAQGFGIITEIDMAKTLAEKLDSVDMLPYKILGACNPAYAYETLQIEENIGLFLPCKVLIKDLGNDKVEIVMVNPSELMRMLNNKELEAVAEIVTEKFRAALESI